MAVRQDRPGHPAGRAQNARVVASLSPRRRLLVAGVAVLLAGALGAVAGVLAWPRAKPALGPVPVLLVHGYDGTPADMGVLADRLRAAGRAPVLPVALPERGTGDVEVSARTLAQAVAATGAPKVDLVGYSAGGVVVRAYLALEGGAGRARRVVLLGSPNHGAGLAGLALGLGADACTGACAELSPGSSLLARLNAGDETPGPADYTSIWTDRDQTVTPPSSAVLAGARNVRVQDVCAGSAVGHGGLARDPLVVGLVERALDAGFARPPGAADCAALRADGAAHGLTGRRLPGSGRMG